MKNKIVKHLKKLKEKQEISYKVCNKLYATGWRPGVSYGLYKIHKSIVNWVSPVRPILSAMATPTYKLEMFCTIIRTTNTPCPSTAVAIRFRTGNLN